MPEQLLDSAEVGACAEEMRGERMTQRVRRRRLRQAELLAQPRHRPLDAARDQRATVEADKERAAGFEWEGADREIIAHRLGDGGQHRHYALLVSLAGD